MTSAASSTTAVERWACAALVVASVLVLPSPARADAAHADALFKDGRTLLDAKRFDEACPKLAESQKEEPGAGTLLALALCHEGQGKTATAYNELVEAAALGKRVGRADLAAAAQKRAQAMEPNLSRIVVRLSKPASEDSEYDVKRDGEPMEYKQLGTPVAVDPGEHRVDVSAKGKIARNYVVRLSGAGQVEILIDKLEDAPRAAAPAPAPARMNVEYAAPVAAPAEENRGRTQRAIGLTIAGLGVVGLGAGAYFGARALSQRQEARDECPSAPCPTESTDANDRAKKSFGLSVTSLAAGTSAIALGVIVYLMAPSNPKKTASAMTRPTARFVPNVGPTEATVGVVGAF